jgi:acyl-CoA synthetase (AMP-forming)/AMP-acid ligase II
MRAAERERFVVINLVAYFEEQPTMARIRSAAQIFAQAARAHGGVVGRRTVSTSRQQPQSLWQAAGVGLLSGVIGAAVNDRYGGEHRGVDVAFCPKCTLTIADEIKSFFRSVGIAANDAASNPDLPDASRPGGFRGQLSCPVGLKLTSSGQCH